MDSCPVPSSTFGASSASLYIRRKWRVGAGRHESFGGAGGERFIAERPRRIIPSVLRRLYIPVLRAGELPLDPGQARHAREVLRLAEGETVEVFDDRGAVASGVLVFSGRRGAIVRVQEVTPAEARAGWCVAAATPKGERADWMVEKLSELGAEAFVPLIAARSVVVPEGKNKIQRWARIATESAKQSRRRGVMRIESPVGLDEMLRTAGPATAGICLSTGPGAISIVVAVNAVPLDRRLVLFVGPEGGWTDEELGAFERAGVGAARLTETVLRVETAAVAAGAVVGALRVGEKTNSD